MENKDGKETCPNHCSNCRKPLTGAVEVIETKNEDIPVIHVKETSDRNWIACDACNLVVCKSCCENALSGLCNGCLKQMLHNNAFAQSLSTEPIRLTRVPETNRR